ncbi:MAG: DUF169 domain-containing protein [Candidatus Acidiferrales bacterium]|jgi:uncharacterized protein (DUF169 family)
MGNVPNWKSLEVRLAKPLSLARRPVAVAFLDREPSGVEKFTGTEPAGCSFWRLAAEGRVFYTVPGDHFNCAVGSYTHNIPLAPERQHETEQTLKMMFELGYVRPEEVPQIPRLEKTPAAVAYAPLGDTPVAPDVVLFAANPATAMLLHEAALRAGKSSGVPALGRPTCMALPAAMKHGAMLSLGCMGNRLYTRLGEDEMYFVARGTDLEAIAEALEAIVRANVALADYARSRQAQLSTL